VNRTLAGKSRSKSTVAPFLQGEVIYVLKIS